jgi:hypothetical protein
MNCDSENRPRPTNRMKKQGFKYIWKKVKDNPNLFCWVPTENKNIDPEKWNVDNLNLQDVPDVVLSDEYKNKLEKVAKEAILYKKKSLLERLLTDKSDRTIVSVDSPDKYKIVEKFLRETGLKIYGGTAINYYMPENEKFYDALDTPDYDFYSYDPWNHAVQLSDLFYKNGFNYVEARAGIHKGTYKVLVDLWPVADITYMPRREFEKMETTVFNGIHVVFPFKLLEAMYKEISDPYGNASRWPKVIYREKLLQKWANPLAKKFRCSKDLFVTRVNENMDPIVRKLLERTYKFLIDKDRLFCGAFAYNVYMELGAAEKRVNVSMYNALTETAKKDTEELFTELLKIHRDLNIITSYYPAKDINNTSYKIMMGRKHEICEFTDLSICTAYKRLMGKNIVSIDYMKYELYDLIVFANDPISRENSKCKIQYLNKIQDQYYKKNNLSEFDPSPFQRFNTQCIGPFQENIKIELLDRWLKHEEEAKSYGTYYTKTSKIIEIPRIKPPKECIGKEKNKCLYPCSWNKKYKSCSSTPKGSYKPGHNNDEL